MLLISLQSGSSGNCIYVESQGARLLFDAGLSAAQTEQRLAQYQRTARQADALFISHDHSDHVRCAGIYSRKFEVPLYVTEPTHAASWRVLPADSKVDLRHFRSGETVRVGQVAVTTIQTPHDAADGVVFLVDDGRHRLGICTDFGHVFADLKNLVGSVDALFLESNYDEKMLADGPYPRRLKERISGPRGHISNREAAELVAQHASDRLQWLCLAHLSDQNNSPDKALAAHRDALGKVLPIQVTSRYRATEVMEIGENVPTGFRPQMTFDF